ncbi:MAG: hypothetical protein ACXQTR_02475 [Candidatus Methanospirareceae archaeon]
MPTIDESIAINLKDATGAIPAETYGEIIVIGEHTSDTSFNHVDTCYSQAEVEAIYTDGPIVEATAKIFAQGVAHVKTVNVYDGATKQYATVLEALLSENVDYDIIVPTIDASDNTNMELLVSHANTNRKLLICPALGTASAVTTNITALTPSEYVYAIVHDDSDSYNAGELAGAIAGVIGLLNPWIPPEWVTVSGIAASGYTQSEIKTLEENETHPMNTVIKVVSSEISAGLSMKPGKYVDIARTKIYLSTEIKNALVNLKYQLANKGRKIPYEPRGLEMIKATIEKILRTNQSTSTRTKAIRADGLTDDGEVDPGFTVTMPQWSSISASDKASRLLRNVEVEAFLSGAVSKIKLDLIISL